MFCGKLALPITQLLINSSILALVVPGLYTTTFTDRAAQDNTPELMALHEGSKERPCWCAYECWVVTRRLGVLESRAYFGQHTIFEILLVAREKGGYVARSKRVGCERVCMQIVLTWTTEQKKRMLSVCSKIDRGSSKRRG